MKLCELLDNVEIVKQNVNTDMEIKSIVNDSRRVVTGDLFVAVRGKNRDGNDYIDEAIKRGASAVLTDDEKSCIEGVSYILVKSARRAVSRMWSNYYGNPGKSVKTVAITGTNGKTTSAYYLYNVLRSAGVRCALLSTVEILIDGERVETDGSTVMDIYASMTTPEPNILYALYNKMKKKGVEVAVIEASSHAIDQHRLDELNIEIAAFTNLSREHLDYHGGMDEYFCAKKRLFQMSRMCVINIDDEYGKSLYEEYKSKSLGFSQKNGAEFFIKRLEKSSLGYKYDLAGKMGRISLETSLYGEYNVYNSALAVICARILNIDVEHIKKGIFETDKICGRMERYRDKEIYIDYAHTPAAMEKSIEALKEMKIGKRLIALFGCGGNRDKGKRAEMGRIVTKLADLTVITSDNPRNENPLSIICDTIKGVEKNKEIIIIPNRQEAIEFTARRLKDGEVLILLGKGHENYEINEMGKIHFDEREVLDRVFSLD